MNGLISLGVLFPFVMTTLGSAMVFLFKEEMKQSVQSIILGFAAGVMIAASIFSLLLPSIETGGIWVTSLGFMVGALFLTLLDKLLPHLHLNSEEPEGLKSGYSKATLLFLAVTLHNIPEGMAVGLAFALALKEGSTSLLPAFVLALGIGLQNLPEGAAISLPLRSSGKSKQKAFWLGSLSGIVEPLFASIAILLYSLIASLLPFLLSFAAGAMMFVTVEELIPEAQSEAHSHYATYGILIGFVVMMVLDVVLG